MLCCLVSGGVGPSMWLRAPIPLLHVWLRPTPPFPKARGGRAVSPTSEVVHMGLVTETRRTEPKPTWGSPHQ
jgi:hypothetical protein